MSVVTKGGVSPDMGSLLRTVPISGLVAGEDIANGDMCYIKSDGKAWRTDATAADAKAVPAGMCFRGAKAGEPVTLWNVGTRSSYGATGAFTPGAKLFLAATPGQLDTAGTTGDAVGVAQAISDTDIRITRAI